jgi:hypothetical protein
MTSTKAPVVFIHGLWLDASSWAPWQERFAAAGSQGFGLPCQPCAWPGRLAELRHQPSHGRRRDHAVGPDKRTNLRLVSVNERRNGVVILSYANA